MEFSCHIRRICAGARLGDSVGRALWTNLSFISQRLAILKDLNLKRWTEI